MGKKERTYPERFLRVTHSMLNQPAWRDLNGNEVKLLMDVWKRHNGANNGKISYSVREAAELLHCSKDTAMRAFHRLQDHGFLAITTAGGFNLKFRHATEWRLTFEHAPGMQPTHDYTHWAPDVNALEVAAAKRAAWAARNKGLAATQS